MSKKRSDVKKQENQSIGATDSVSFSHGNNDNIEDLLNQVEMFHQLTSSINDVLWVIDAETMDLHYVSSSVYTMLGYTTEEVLGKPIAILFTPEDAELAHQMIIANKQKFIGSGESSSHHIVNEFRHRRKDGSLVWTEIVTSFYRNETRKITEIRGVSRDITAWRDNNLKLLESEAKYRLLIENVSEGIIVIQDGRIRYSNPATREMFQYSQEELFSAPFPVFVYRDDREMIINSYNKRMRGETVADRFQLRVLRKDRSVIWIELSVVKLQWEGRAATLNFVTEITERKKTEDMILHMSYHDALTGLYNRTFFEKTEQIPTRPENLPLTYIMADVNGLKMTNDAFGHIAGDQLLKLVTTIIAKSLRKQDLFFRVGGDEFVMLLPNTDEVMAQHVIKRLQSKIKATKTEHLVLSVSFGAATQRKVEETLSYIGMKADNFMYASKLTESNEMKHQTLNRIIASLDDEIPGEKEHCKRVQQLCFEIGSELNLNSSELKNLSLAAGMHDIGMIGIDKTLSLKPGRLNDVEWAEFKRHPEIGYQILRQMSDLANISEIVLSHHERVDGQGFPRGITSSEIPLAAKILTIADFYDAIRFKETGPQHSKQKAIELIHESIGKQFDENIATTLIELIRSKED